MRTAARHDNRIGNQIQLALDEVAPYRRDVFDAALPQRRISSFRRAGAKILEELRKRIIPRSEENRIRVLRCLLWKGGNMQPTETDIRAFGAIMICQRVCPVRGRDVDLNDHKIGFVVNV